MKIGKFNLNSKRTFVIAEIGGNHEGSFSEAKKLIKEASKAGADAVKFQVYQPEQLIRVSATSYSHTKSKGQSQLERFKKLQFTFKQYQQLAQEAKKNKVVFMASVFDRESADLVAKLSPVFKVASGDVNNFHLLTYLKKFKKPLIISTGATEESEIKELFKVVPKSKVVLLHCVANYPALPENIHLQSIPYLKDKFKVPVGYSDHMLGFDACVHAVTVGANVIEKHFTLNKNRPRGDHFHSVTPVELKQMVDKIRLVEAMLGEYSKKVSKTEIKMKPLIRRSYVAKTDVAKGTFLKESMIVPIRPESSGIKANQIHKVLNKKAKKNIPANKTIKVQDLV